MHSYGQPSALSNVDTSDATYYYFGEAPVGSANSDAAWRIARMTKASPYLLRYASGGSPSCVWDDRSALSYS
jgi:hypothetical protein